MATDVHLLDMQSLGKQPYDMSLLLLLLLCPAGQE
jgi:hypothetical protein